MISRILLFLPLLVIACFSTATAQTLISKNSSWKYLDNGSNQGTSWRQSSFNDASWATGNAQLGYGDGDEATQVEDGPNGNRYITTYFRKSITVDLADVQLGATLGVMRDDGAVAYLNGNEVFRTNMPSGTINYNTVASSVATGSNESAYFETNIPTSSFIQGTNVIAVEVHQSSGSSPDVSFNLELVGLGGGTGTVNITRGPYLQKASATSMVVRWRSDATTDSKVFYGFSPNSLSASKSDPVQTTEHEVEITGLNPGTTYYYVVGNSAGTFQTGSASQYFKTAPTIGSTGNYRMWVLGDAGTANSNARAVRDAYYNFNGNAHTDAILMLGDNAYNAGTDAEYQTAVFENMYEDLLQNTVLWSCPGNHDYFSGANAQNQTGTYYDIFTFPKNGESGGLASGTEAYYSFDYGNMHVISLDSYGSDRSTNGPMGSWLANDLANTTQEWIIAIFHHPPYTKGSHDSDTETRLIEMRQNLLPVLEASGVDLVLSGHSHSYERSHLIQGHYGASSSFDDCTMLLDGGGGKEDGNGAYIKDTNGVFDDEGAVFVVAGSSGKISGGNLNHPVMYASINQLGSVVLDVSGTTMNVKFLNNIGNVADYFTVKKEYQNISDSDADGYDDSIECPTGHPCFDTDNDCLPDYLDTDSDGDGVPDETDACRTAIGTVANYGCPEVNAAPEALDDNFTTEANSPLAGSVLVNDTDPNPGDQLSVTQTPVVNVSNGVLTLNSGGGFGYTPYTDFSGSDYFVYEVCDNGTPQKCDQATAYINVSSGPNTAPQANNDNYSTDINTTLNANILNNDTDPDFNGLVLSTNPVSGPSNGFVTLYSSGTMIYTPFNGFAGVDNFTYQVCDDGTPSYCDQATVTITVVDNQNLSPIANDDTNSTAVNVSVGGNVLSNDSDPNNDALAVNTTPVSGASNGAVILYGNGSYSYSPNNGFTGTDVFTYQVCDNGSPVLCDEATVTITIVGSNDPPVAQNDNATTVSGTAVYISVLGNDSDPNGDQLSVSTNAIQGPDHGTVTLDGPGVYDYQPEIGYTGTDSFLYEVCDNGSPILCDQAIVYITMTNGSNSPPIAVDDNVYTTVDAPYGANALDNDSDPEGHALTLTTTPVSQPTNGTVFLYSNGGYAYYPDAGYIGTDVFTYEVCDNGNPVLCDEANIYVTVSATPNNPPVANDNSFTTNLNTTLNGNILSDDTEPDGDNIIFNTTPINNVDNGSLVLYTNGNFTYTPNNGFYGTDNFTYQICDDGTPEACDNGLVTISVNPPANDPPVTEGDLYNTSLNIGVSENLLNNDYDPNGDNLILTTTPVVPVSNGNLNLYPNGQFSYQPNSNFSGLETFVYEVCDDAPLPACSQETVYINISASPNNPPIAEDDLFSTMVETPVQGNIIANDSEPDGEGLVVNTIPVQPPSNGSILLSVNGGLSYTPNPGFVGIDSFVYEVCDNNVVPLCDQAVISIVVTSTTNNGPVANDDSFGTEINTALSGNLTTNDSDPDNDALTVQSSPIVGPQNGSLILYSNGGFSYTPNNGFTGNDSFVYEICDNGSPVICDQATVSVNVFEITNNAPIANDDSYILVVNSTFYEEVDVNDSDPDNDNLTLITTPVIGPQHGTVVLYSTGLFGYTPNTNYSGTDSFTYEICDDGSPSLCDQAIVELLINSLNNNLPPEAQDDFKSTSYNVGFFINVINNDTDPDGNNLFTTGTLVTPPANGSAYMSGNGTYTYTPFSGYVGADSFEYEVCDDGTPVLCDNAVVFITMTSNNNAPSAVNDSYTVAYEGFLAENVLINDSDPDGNALQAQTNLVIPPSNGTVNMSVNGGFTFQPDVAFFGNDSFRYRVCDNGAPMLCSEATVFITVTAPDNNAPEAVDDAFAADMNANISGNILANDTDVDGDNLTYNGMASAPNNGTVNINAAGDILYTPNNNFVGVDNFTYQVCDDGAPVLCDQATVTLTIENIANIAPIAVNDTKSTSYNVGFTYNLTNNDSDPNGDALLMATSAVSGPFVGTAVLYASGQVTYTPQSGFVGMDSLVYEVCDDGSPVLCSTATFVITMTSNNNRPIANTDNYTAYPGIPLTGNLMTNDSDPDNNPINLSTTAVQSPTKGQVTLYSNGNFEYVVNNGSSGSDSFRYSICDNGGPNLCDEATVYISIVQENLQPNAEPDLVSTDIDVVVNGSVINNDSDPDGDNLLVTTTPLSGPSNGSLVLYANGGFTYTPDAGFVGTDVFVYEVCDDGMPVQCDIAAVTIQVGPPPNEAPNAMADNFSLLEDAVLNATVLGNDSDPDGDLLLVNTNPVVAPLNGALDIDADGTFSYTPTADFNGTDSFVYEVCDDSPGVNCSTATVYLTIAARNDAPFTTNDSVSILENTSVVLAVLANDYDIDGNINPATLWLFNQPSASEGTATVNPDGTITFVPATDFAGTVDPFIYQICDDGTPLPSKCNIGSIYITVVNGNDPPVAVADNFTLFEDLEFMGNVIGNDWDPDGGPLSVSTIPVAAPNGTLSLSPNGGFAYTPYPEFSGTDSFAYEVCDSNGACDTAVVSLTISPVNDQPEAHDDTYVINEDGIVAANILINEFDVDGDQLFVTTTPISGPGMGAITLDANGDMQYFPPTDYFGDAEVDYEVCDNGSPSLCDTATIFISINPINDAPVAVDDYFSTDENVTLNGNLLNNDFDVENDNIGVKASPIIPPSNGTVALSQNGGFTYTPDPNYSGTDSFVYEICDNGQPSLCTTATVYINVSGINQPPQANTDYYTTDEDVALVGNVFDNDLEFDGDNLIINTTPTVGTSNGTVYISPGGSFSYFPSPNFYGWDSFYYEVCDDSPDMLCDTALVSINIQAINDSPILVNDSISTFQDSPVQIFELANDTDIDGNLDVATLSIMNNPPASEGSLGQNGDGSITFTPNPTFYGDVTPVQYAICDDGFPLPRACAVAYIYIHVVQGNQPPVALDDNYSTDEDEPVSGNVLNNDSDPEGGLLAVNTNPVVAATYGTLALAADGSFTYSPDAGFYGVDSFVYEVCDDGLPSYCSLATVYISVVDCPVAEFNVPTICQNESILFVAEDQGGGATYFWDFNLGANPRFSNDRVTFVDFSNPGPRDIFLTVTKNGCERTTQKTIIVHNQPYIDVGPDVSICQGDSAILGGLPTGPAGATYYWSPSVGLSATDIANPRASPPSTTTYTLFVTLGNCTEVDNVVVTVKELPRAYAGGDNFVCEGNSVQLGGPFGPEGGATYRWSPGVFLDDSTSLTPIATPTVTTTYTLTATLDGCENTDVIEVGVAPAPQADAGPDIVTCYEPSGPGVQLGNPSNEQGIIYQWSPSTYLDNQYASNPISTAPVSITYTMTAIKNGCFREDEVIITIGDCSGPPEAEDDLIVGQEDQFAFFNILSNDMSLGFNLYMDSIISWPQEGIIDFYDLNGNLRYVPNLNFNGTDSFSYRVCDDNQPVQCDTAIVILTIMPVNDVPTAVDDGMDIVVNGILNGDLLANDFDVDGGDVLALNTAPVSSPTNGNLNMNSDGSFTYLPATDYEGIDQFSYEVCDNGSPTLCSTAIVTVIVGACVNLELRAYLQGPYDSNADSMYTVLNMERRILPGQTPPNNLVVPTPAGQPYGLSPWDYYGTEGLDFTDTSYAPSVVDWVLVSLRTGKEKSTEVFRHAGLLHSDGRITFVDPCFRTIDLQLSYYVVLEHRNHMGIMTNVPIPIVNRNLVYDFRLEDSYRNLTGYGQLQSTTGFWMMIAGDGDQIQDVTSYDINGQDKIIWNLENGNFDRYLPSDFDMNGDVSGQDKILWNENNGVSSRVPK